MNEAVQLLGVFLVVAGIGLLSIAAAAIVAGVALIVVGEAWGHARRSKRREGSE